MFVACHRSAMLALAVFLGLAGVAGAQTYPLNQGNPASSGFGTFTGGFDLGWEFTCQSSNITVTHLGVNVPQNDARTVSLWSLSSTTPLAQVSVTAGTGWRWVQLSSPVALTQGTSYIVTECGNGYWHTFNNPGGSWSGDSNITYVQGRWVSTTTPTFPTNTQASWMGVADIGYSSGPPAPSSITVPASSNTGNYTVSWSAVSGATSYDLQEDTSASFTAPTNVYNGSNTTFNVTGKGNGSYYYRVRANSSSGSSAWTTGSNPCVVTLPPAAPSSITVPATSVTGNYTVSWSASATATSYDLQEANNAAFTGASTVYSGANTSFNVTGKTTGTWYYQVRAVNAGGSSAWTQGANGCQIVAPAAPASVTVPATSVTGSYAVSWTASTGATSYDLEEDTSASFTAPTNVYTGANLSFNVTGKTTGTFYYRARAGNGAGSSGWTAGANGCQIVPPTAPTSITVPATSVTGSYTVSWTSPGGATSYDLEEDTSPSFTAPTTVYTGANLSHNVTGKTSGTFYYRVRANGVAGSSGWTTGANGCQIVPPAAPAGITVPATSLTGNYTVSWTAETGATSYDLEEDTSAAFPAPATAYSGANPSFNVTGKVAGTYYYRVRAVNGAGASAWTQGANGCQIVPPSAPTPLTVPATSSTGTYTVTWGASTGALTYDLDEDVSSAFTNPSRVSSAASTSYTAVGKANGTYYYRVRAVNGAGPSGWTVDTTGCTVTLVAPNAPASVTVPASSSTGSFTVTWTAVTGANRYEAEEATDAGFTTATSVYLGGLTALSVTGKSNGTYFYRVRAGNTAGWSGWTAGGNGCTVFLAPPVAPATITVPASSSTGNYTVTWSSVTGATGYDLEEATDAGFASAAQVYLGPSASYSAAGRGNGTYYYRVRAANSQGNSAWTAGGNGCVVTLTSPGLLVQSGAGNPSGSAEAPGAAGVRMLHLELAAGQLEAVRLQGLTVHATGSGNDATELGAVTLWRDADGNGFADLGEAQAGTGTFAADDGSVAFVLASEPAIAAGTTAWYLVTADVAPTAMPGNTFQLNLSPAADAAAQGWTSATAAVITGTGVWGGVVTVATSGAGSLSLSRGPNGPAARRVPAPASGAPMLQVVLAASSLEGVQVSRVRVASSGTGDESLGAVARLYLDVNGDGQATASDVLLGTAPFTADDGSVSFTGLAVSVPAGNHATLLVAYDLGGEGTVGTYAASVGANADVEAVGSTSGLGILASGAPVTGFPQEVVGRGEMEPVFFIGACGGPVGPGGWAGLLLLVMALAGAVSRRRA